MVIPVSKKGSDEKGYSAHGLRKASATIAHRALLRLGRVLINPGTPFDVRYAPDSGAKADIAGLPRWAMTGRQVHSISSSARPISVFGTMMPSASAVLRLMTNSNLVACTTGNSAGFSPLRTLPV
jgi:hypothetical protein